MHFAILMYVSRRMGPIFKKLLIYCYNLHVDFSTTYESDETYFHSEVFFVSFGPILHLISFLSKITHMYEQTYVKMFLYNYSHGTYSLTSSFSATCIYFCSRSNFYSYRQNQWTGFAWICYFYNSFLSLI